MNRLLSSPFLNPALVILSALLYLGYSLYYGFVGFPLDDAWIHQTYSRNLALHHQFAYNAGEPSVGSTSPLWTMLLTPTYLLPDDHRLWAYVLGAILLALTGWIVYRLSNVLFPGNSLLPILTSIFSLLEWHLAWAAFSGMETILFVFLSLLALERHLAGVKPFVSGLIIGLLALTRPEGVILLFLVVLDTLWRRKKGARSLTWPEVTLHLTLLLLGFSLLMLPYFALHLTISGHVFPNTFYAKQAEYYEILARLPLWVRWVQLTGVTVVGAQVLLIPGCLYAAYRIFKFKRTSAVLPLAWWFALVTIYAIRLPVAYQHGRYLIPSIPILILFGIWGTKNLPYPHRIARQVLLLSISVLLFVFWLQGARQYATDVRIIDSELAATGQWLRENTPRDALIAAHDIGAIGYFSERNLIDTAGLASPEVTPFIRDEEKILAFLEEREADYVAIFPSWYPEIATNPALRAIYSSTADWIVDAGGDNIVVYETVWNSP